MDMGHRSTLFSAALKKQQVVLMLLKLDMQINKKFEEVF